MTSGRAGSSIWLSGYPQVPRGAYGQGLTLEVAQSGVNVDRMNAPTVQVNWGPLFGGGTCGPYTLPKPPTDGSVAVVALSAGRRHEPRGLPEHRGPDQLGRRPVQREPSGVPGLALPDGQARWCTLPAHHPGPADVPRPPSATDPGGDCDPTQPGVQFIFGGDSHVYVPNGGVEICAGPNPTDPGNGKQIAVYGVPATPRLVPASVTGTDRRRHQLGQCAAHRRGFRTRVGDDAVLGTETLRYAGYTVPTGYTIDSVAAARLVQPADRDGTPRRVPGRARRRLAFCAPTPAPAGAGNQAQIFDVTTCMMAGNRIASPYDVKWSAGASGTCSGATCPKLDGIEFIVTLKPDRTPTPPCGPQNGCITDSPNHWYGIGAPDCALLGVDAPFWDQLPGRRGRMSIKGTVYAPSAAIDVDDTDVWYPIVSRGIVARHLRIRGFKYHAATTSPRSATGSTRPGDPPGRASTRAARTPEPAPRATRHLGRAAVTFDAGTNKPRSRTGR